MSAANLTELVRALLDATPEQRAAIALILGVKPERKRARAEGGGRKPVAAKGDAHFAEGHAIQRMGRLRYGADFNDVWVGDRHYDLRERTKARLCIQYLVEQGAFAVATARHLVEEIDPYVRQHGNFPPAADIRIHHYFSDRNGPLTQLRQTLVLAAGRQGRFYLNVG